MPRRRVLSTQLGNTREPRGKVWSNLIEQKMEKMIESGRSSSTRLKKIGQINGLSVRLR
jgi:hypothetical protein